MAFGSRLEGGAQILSAGVRRTIQSIKEIVGNHSDADIYVALKETNMDPNETAQKLLNQDPFHEVKRKRDKKKDSTGYRGSSEPRKYNEHGNQGVKNSTYSDSSVQRGNYSRNPLPVAGYSREFRVVRDNRVNPNANKEMKPPSPQSTNEQIISQVSAKGPTGNSSNKKLSGGHLSSQALDGSSASVIKVTLEERRSQAPSGLSQSQGQGVKPKGSQSHPVALASNNSVGLYSSSSDPVHVPSPDSRLVATIGAIKREVGVVGVRRQSSENVVKSPSRSSSFSNSHLVRERPSSRESFRAFNAISKPPQLSQSTVAESAIPSMTLGRSLMSNQYNNRSLHQLAGHQKVTQPNKEWKPKSTQKSSINGPGVIGTPAKSVPPPHVDSNNDSEVEAAQLQDTPSQMNSYENQKVIIAEHIRVSETDRCRLNFGSFGTDFDSSRNFVSGSQAVGSSEDSSMEPSMSLSASSPDSSYETSGNKHVDLPDGQVKNSGTKSPESVSMSEHQLPEKDESSSPQNLDDYADIGLVRDHSPSYTPSESHQLQDTPELPSFSTYDLQTGYDIRYFRPADEAVRGQGLPSPHEVLSSYTANIPASTIAMVQQQQPPVPQMYPQVHVSHFANLMPYRQFLSPVYVPPVPMPGYSSNPSYPHPSNGSSYLLMPGGSSHLSANSLKYGIQQFKPVPAGSPTGFANFTGPAGYAINAPGVIGSATGIEDSSRLKYKDGNLYVPNQQAETSEIWIQNPRELPGMQSASYYNMPGQTPHATYLQSHTGHASFNAAAQSSHMQFQPGLYHPPPQPASIPNPHHLASAMGGNVGVGVGPAAPGTQVGAYQQPQMGHLNWTGSF